MCNNLIVLYTFIVIKVIVVLILPIIYVILRKKDFSKYILGIDIVLLLFFLICSTFNINKCVYNSNIEGIKRTNNENRIKIYNEMHPVKPTYNADEIKPLKTYKTYTGKTLYYFNQNNASIKDAYYECGDTKVYFNSFGNSIATLSTAVSTLYERNINPVTIFNIYKDDAIDICDSSFSIDDVYISLMKIYSGIKLSEISVNQIDQSIRDGGLVIAELSANESSKLTCDSSYIIIYSKGLDGKYMISDSNLPKKSFVCPYSSEAYGNIIDSENMNNSWSLQDIDNETVRYYLVRK